MITTLIIASLLTILGIVVLSGKGDMLIAGYNTGLFITDYRDHHRRAGVGQYLDEKNRT